MKLVARSFDVKSENVQGDLFCIHMISHTMFYCVDTRVGGETQKLIFVPSLSKAEVFQGDAMKFMSMKHFQYVPFAQTHTQPAHAFQLHRNFFRTVNHVKLLHKYNAILPIVWQ